MTYEEFLMMVGKTGNVINAGWVAKYYGVPMNVMKEWIVKTMKSGLDSAN